MQFFWGLARIAICQQYFGADNQEMLQNRYFLMTVSLTSDGPVGPLDGISSLAGSEVSHTHICDVFNERLQSGGDMGKTWVKELETQF